MTQDSVVSPAPVEDPVETGNFPDPDDGPQDDIPQTTDPQFDEDLVDGGGSGAVG